MAVEPLICPSGQISPHPGVLVRTRCRISAARKLRFIQAFQHDLGRPACFAKIFRFPSIQIRGSIAPSRPDKRGGSRVVTNAGRDAVDARAPGAIRVRRAVFRERPGAQDERRCAYGKTVWSRHPLLVPSLRRLFQPDRVRSAANPQATVTRRIRRRGEHGISRKTIAQGMPDCSVCTCTLVCVSFAHLLHTSPRVQRAPGIPCLPPTSRVSPRQARTHRAAGKGSYVFECSTTAPAALRDRIAGATLPAAITSA